MAATLGVLLVAAVCIRLGFWQLDRLEQRRARNAAFREAQTFPPVSLDSALLVGLARDPERFVNRRVRLRGEWDAERTLVLRGRAQGGRPGVHLVTPLRIPGSGVAVLVNRGWVPSPDAATVDPAPFAEPGLREVEGLVQRIPSTGNRGAPSVSRGGGLTFQRLDRAALRDRLSYPVLPVYLQRVPNAAPSASVLPQPVPLPDLGEGPHLGYAVQWFSFAAIALIGWGVVAFRHRRH